MAQGEAPFWRMQGVSKRYGGVLALADVDFACEPGIHAVLGENGAGKSTLIKIIAGVVQPTAGDLFLEGRKVSFPTPVAANQAGIVCIFQELSLLPDLSVADNICITEPPTALRPDRPARPAPARRAAARPDRLRGRAPDGARPQSFPVPPPDGRDRQGARPRAQAFDPRRGDLGV